MKGKPWMREMEDQLRGLVAEGCSISEVAEKMGKSYESIRTKMKRMNLKPKQVEDDHDVANQLRTPSTSLELPEDLPSVEEQLRVLAGALKALQIPELEKSEILRLRAIIGGVKAYKDLFGDYVDYRGIEQKVDNAIEWLEKLAKERENLDRKKRRG